MDGIPSASYSLILRVEYPHRAGMLGAVLSAVGDAGGIVGAIDIVSIGTERSTRDIAVNARDSDHEQLLVDAVNRLPEVRVVQTSDRTFLLHLGGKLVVTPKVPIRTRDDLSMAYTPGVARICLAIAADREKAFNLTIKRNTVAVVTDGTAVLGLGNIGPEAAMPVMEGKAVLFKEFAGVDAFPICLNTTDVEEIIACVKAIAPGFGGINLEDISAPRCFEIEDRLRRELDIPVYHDDQHGTAVVTLAALINALKVVGKDLASIKVVVNGIGAAGTACTKILLAAGVRNIIGCDRHGVIEPERSDLNPAKRWYAEHTNPKGVRGDLRDALRGVDLFVGLSGPHVLGAADLELMGPDPIVFAMANPVPEIMPEEAAGHVRVMATGRSDYPNQINNVLCFPGMFRGVLDARARDITDRMNLAAAYAIANVIPDGTVMEEYIIPSVFDERVAPAVAEAVMEAAVEDGVARRGIEQVGGEPAAPLLE
jgi:malate dehydrogenase (oxaloacetate-decarboxylating)